MDKPLMPEREQAELLNRTFGRYIREAQEQLHRNPGADLQFFWLRGIQECLPLLDRGTALAAGRGMRELMEHCRDRDWSFERFSEFARRGKPVVADQVPDQALARLARIREAVTARWRKQHQTEDPKSEPSDNTPHGG
jgi:hypothetical protein